MKKTVVAKLIHKRVQCPHCGSRIIDAAKNTHSEVRLAATAGPWQADYYTKCWHCKAEVGLKKLNSYT
ncbi:MAG: hypothetical protein A4E53_01117 [Pelotomaculum sp. PtaB.Bin104]|nr:MAG: hypothetical protein A4E53_01117 [Pelotomaculum sp. PtaB.Bin104]